MVEPVTGLAAQLLCFKPPHPQETPREGLAEGLLERFSSLNKWLRKKLFTKLNEFMLVFYILSNFQRPQNNLLPPRLLLVTPPLHTPLYPGRLVLVGCCVENCRLAAA